MAQDLSYELETGVWFITSRTIASRLWFVNNKKLERYILAFLAKYAESYGAQLYGFVLMGNHYHLVASFPQMNKAAFLRSFNGIIARLVNSVVPEFDGGRVWSRRARVQLLPEAADVEHWTLYAALNPVSSGLTSKRSEYPGYNSFSDAIEGRKRSFKLVDWADFQNRKRKNSALTPEDCTRVFTLSYSRLPGYEHLSQNDYRLMLLDRAEKRRQEILRERKQAGQGFAGAATLLKVKPGTKPHSTKKSERHTKRPLVLSLSWEAKKIALDYYFSMRASYKLASQSFRSGDLCAVFPPGTYRPFLLCSP